MFMIDLSFVESILKFLRGLFVVIGITAIMLLVGVGAHRVVGEFVVLPAATDPVRREAPPALSCHPMSGEFSSGYILVEVWTSDGECDYPHIVRMKASEYWEWLEQPEDL